MRKLLTGEDAPELTESKTLKVKTKCPQKWMLVDLETGERYIGRDTDGPSDWKRLKHAGH